MGSGVGRVVAAVATGGISEVARAATKQEKAPTYDAAAIEREAQAKAKASQLADIDLKNSGRASTQLGGDVVKDNSNIKKKKLLGE